MRHLLPLLAVAAVLFIGCQNVTLTAPTVTATAITPGGTLRLEWTAVTSAAGYYVYLDGTKNTVSATSYDVIAPTEVIEVSAYSGSTESDKWSLNTGVEKTTSISVDDIVGAGPNYAFYFNSSGTAVPLPLSQATDIDFVMDTTAGGPQLASPDIYSPPYNSKDNSSAEAATTDFDGYEEAPASGTYNTLRAISSGAVYALWIDPTNNGWSTDDHYAKMKVEDISGNTVHLTLGYQTVGGIRWLKNKS